MGKQFFFSVILFWSIVFSKHSMAQAQHEIDSLLSLLKTTQEDSSKFKILDGLRSRFLSLYNNEDARKYTNAQIELAKNIIATSKDPEYLKRWGKQQLGNAYNSLAQIFYRQGEDSIAIENLETGLKIHEEINNKRGIGFSLLYIGIIRYRQSLYADAIEYTSKAKTYFEELKDNRKLIDVYCNLGNSYDEQGNYPEAMKNYVSSLKVSEEIGDKREVAGAYTNIGHLFDQMGNPGEAIANHSKALKINQEIGDKKGLCESYINMGGINSKNKNYPEALKYFNACLKLAKEIESKSDIALSLTNLGYVYNDLRKFKDALKYFFEALGVSNELNDQYTITDIDKAIGNVYSDMGNYKEAKAYYQKSLSEAREIGARDLVPEIYSVLSDVCEKDNDLKNSIRYLRMYSGLKDSLLNETNSKQIVEMKTKYETEKKDKEILLLNKNKQIQDLEIKKQKTLKYAFIGGLAALLVLSFLVYRNYRTRKLLELQALRNKIAHDLHDDIGSTLNSISIYSEVAQNKSKEKIPELELIGESSRKVMDAMSDIVWTINPDNDSFEKIIFRMRSLTHLLMKAKNLEYTFKADEKLNDLELPMQTRKNFYLIFKEALNNLLKYSHATRSAISLSYSENIIELFIRDNGVGFDAASPPRGNGLNSMKQRADKIKAKFNIESSVGNGTSVELHLKT